MTTGNDWLSTTRNYLMSGMTENRNKLALPYTKGSGQLTFQYAPSGIREGATLSIGTNTFYVWAINGQTATVSAGEDASTDADAPVGSLVRVSPRFTDDAIWKALSAELGSLSSPASALYGIGTIDLTYNPILTGYDLSSIADNMISVYEVKYLTPGPQLDNPRIPDTQYRVNRNAITTSFPSGISLQLFQAAYPGYNVRVVYKSYFQMPSTPLANVDSTGLLPSAQDIPPIGAAIRLMSGREIKRNFTESQGDTRRASEVPPGAIMQSSRQLQVLRAQRIAEEAARLDAMYPNRRA